MMRLKTNSLKFTIRLSLGLLAIQFANAQEVTSSAVVELVEETKEVQDSVKTEKPFEAFKLDGVAGVVGDYLILESDIDRSLLEIKSQVERGADVTPCQVLGNLLENKLLAHQAVQDSLEVPDGRVNSEVDQIISRFARQLGSEQKVVDYYKKDNIADLRAELFQFRKEAILVEQMNTKIIESVDVTPDEIKTFFERIPEDQVPTIGVELEMSRIVIEPKASEEERQKVIDQLNSFRSDILDNGSSFATKAVLYSDDGGTRGEGGLMSIDRSSPLVKEFRDVAFSLQEGEVSEPFETEFGFHIVTLDKMKGDRLDIRHILLIPKIGNKEEEEAKDLIGKIRKRIIDKELTFEDAAKEFSDEKETKFEGGALVNDFTLDKRFELNKIDPDIYPKVSNLAEEEVSLVFNDPGRTGNTRYMIYTVKNLSEEHKADYVKDYVKIKELALREKQILAIEKWQKEKIEETYIKINGENRDCEFVSNWLKK